MSIFGKEWPLHHFTHFEIVEWDKSSFIIEAGGTLQITGKIKNNSADIATTYLIIRLAKPYNEHNDVIFDTDKDFLEARRHEQRIVDIKAYGEADFCVNIPIPDDIDRSILDIQLELWSPRRLYWESGSTDGIALFYRSPWSGAVDVINPKDLTAKVFISYSWFSNEHIRWVDTLAQELAKRQIKAVLDRTYLRPGELLTTFMKTAVKEPIVLVILSESYVDKIENQKGNTGAEFEFHMITAQILRGRSRQSVIPILKDNPSGQIPLEFASAYYLNMDVADWRTRVLTELTEAIRNLS